jgi:uncharacterized phage-associated protein
MNTLDAKYVAECLVYIASQNLENNDMTNLKLQKLLYYSQGTFLAMYGQKLFEQAIIKWQYGPVVPAVYQQYKSLGNQIIESSEIDMQFIAPKQLEVLNDVYDYFGQFSAIKLMNLTHSESPWNAVEMNEEITEELLKDFFNTIVIKNG